MCFIVKCTEFKNNSISFTKSTFNMELLVSDTICQYEVPRGLTLWHSELSCHLRCWYPISEYQLQVCLLVFLPSFLFMHLGREQKMVQVPKHLLPEWGNQDRVPGSRFWISQAPAVAI